MSTFSLSPPILSTYWLFSTRYAINIQIAFLFLMCLTITTLLRSFPPIGIWKWTVIWGGGRNITIWGTSDVLKCIRGKQNQNGGDVRILEILNRVISIKCQGQRFKFLQNNFFYRFYKVMLRAYRRARSCICSFLSTHAQKLGAAPNGCTHARMSLQIKMVTFMDPILHRVIMICNCWHLCFLLYAIDCLTNLIV